MSSSTEISQTSVYSLQEPLQVPNFNFHEINPQYSYFRIVEPIFDRVLGAELYRFISLRFTLINCKKDRYSSILFVNYQIWVELR